MRNRVVVITGASSGIGRAAARQFAAQGCNVVLAARRGWALESAREECESVGPRAICVVTDMTDEYSVQQLAETAVREFGQIDVWVNNASVGVYGSFEEVPSEAFRRVIDVNVNGYANGARAVLPHFRRQGEGTLVNVASVAGKFGLPYMSAYVAAKHAVVGLTDVLREELIGSGILVSMVLPASVDTPFFQNAANYSGQTIRPMRPVFPVERVAAAVLHAASSGKHEVYVPWFSRSYAVQRELTPGLMEKIAAVQGRDQFDGRPSPRRDGNLYRPSPGFAESEGGWRERLTARPDAAIAGVLGLVAAAAFGFMRWRSRPAESVEGLEQDVNSARWAA